MIAASSWLYVSLAWAFAAAILAVYGVSMLRRGKRLSREVPPESRRWM